MKIKEFAIERYFAQYEFSTEYLLSCSDCDGLKMQDVLDLASPEELDRWEQLTLGYTESLGSEPLRQAIRQHYQTIGMDEVVVASPGEANFILMNLLLGADDEFVCMAPMYQSLYQVAKALGCRVSYWMPVEESGDWWYDPSELEKLLTNRTKLLVLNFPHNPTGFSPTAAEYEAIIQMARKRGIFVFSDEMYRFLNHTNAEVLPSMCDVYEDSVSLWGTSKTLGLAGLRLGWLTSKNNGLIKEVEKFKDYLSICSAAPSEVLATIALNHLEAFVRPNLEKIQSNTALFESFQKRHAALIDFRPPPSGSTAFVRLHLNETTMEFAEKLVRDTGIMLLPSETFEFGSSHARIGFGRKNIPKILDRLDDFLVQHYPDTTKPNG